MWKVTNIREKELVLEVFTTSVYALVYVSESLRDDKDFILEAVKQDGSALKYASERLRDDKEVVLEAVKQYGLALHYASESHKDDKEVVLEAVKQDSSALMYASRKLQAEFKEKGIEGIEKEIREAKTDKKSTIKPVKQSNFKIKTNKKIK